MKRKQQSATVPAETGGLRWIKVRGTAEGAEELLRAPASGAACVHWRLRIFVTLASSMELVHEEIAGEPFQILWRPDPMATPRPLQVEGDRARIEARMVLHGPGSPGARAVAEHFGLLGPLRVEEVLVRPGDAVDAQGLLFDPDQAAAGPYRAGQHTARLYEASLRVAGASSRLRPALLPWALGTAAALLGAAGTATAVSRLRKPEQPAAVAPGHSHAVIRAAETPRRRWP
jgi:hypothetical protein